MIMAAYITAGGTSPPNEDGDIMLMLYVAVAVSLSIIPSLKALAFIVIEELTSNGLIYRVDVAEGSEPSVVYLMVAPSVEQLIVTV
jgi:hypothetical protein